MAEKLILFSPSCWFILAICRQKWCYDLKLKSLSRFDLSSKIKNTNMQGNNDFPFFLSFFFWAEEGFSLWVSHLVNLLNLISVLVWTAFVVFFLSPQNNSLSWWYLRLLSKKKGKTKLSVGREVNWIQKIRTNSDC